MKKLSLLLLAALALGSCKKNDDNTPSSPTDFLTAKSWRVTAHKINTSVGPINTTTDEYATSPACERDDFVKFNTNKTATYDEGATKCDPSDPQVQSGSWDLNSDGTKLTVMDPSLSSIPIVFDVLALSATNLQLRNTSSYSASGVTASATMDITFSSF